MLLPRALRALARTGQATGPSVSLLQWNMLADSLAAAFPLVDQQCLEWGQRYPLLVEELTRHSPDLLTLQEVDRYDELAAALGVHGYEGLYIPKRRSSDGCALFYRPSRLRCVRHEAGHYESYVEGPANQVYLLGHFASPTGQELVVGCTHLKAKPDGEALRLREAAVLLQRLAAFTPPGVPVLVGGDLNSEPTGPVYTLLTAAPCGLASAYAQACQPPQEPAYTTCKIRPPITSVCTIDYIWYGPGLVPTHLLEIPTLQQLPATLLPCSGYPSDHFALQAVLAFA